MSTSRRTISAAVKPRSRPLPYHHGDLRETLIVAAVRILEERGVEGLSLRECARRAGVSHAAPAHHFGDLRGLLSEVAALGHRRESALMLAARTAAGTDARAALVGVGRAYVEFAVSHRALFGLMHRCDVLDWSRGSLQQAATATRDHLLQTLLAATAGSDRAPPADFESRAMLAWSAVHGFAQLVIEGAIGQSPDDSGAATAESRLLPMLTVLLPALVGTGSAIDDADAARSGRAVSRRRRA